MVHFTDMTVIGAKNVSNFVVRRCLSKLRYYLELCKVQYGTVHTVCTCTTAGFRVDNGSVEFYGNPVQFP